MLDASALHAQPASGNLPVYTSPIDITGLKLQLRVAAPDRETGRRIDVTLPTGLIGPKMSLLFATPLSTLIDQFWNVNRDPTTGRTAREEACDGKDGIKQQVAKAVARIDSSYSAYDITCNLAATGQLVAKQVGYTMYIGYLLTKNTVSFASTSPDTCRAGSGTPVCPNDPRFRVTFATEIVTVVRTPGLCQLTAENGTVSVVAASIDSSNAAGAIGKFFADQKFLAAEVAITNTLRNQPLPIDASFNELRTSPACTGHTPGVSRVLTAFRDLETVIEPREGIILRAVHIGIEPPKLDAPSAAGNAPSPSVPSFTRPMISTAQPLVTAGNAVQLHGQHFPLNISFTNALPLTLVHGAYGENSSLLNAGICLGGGTDLAWDLPGPGRVQRLQGDAQGRCAPSFQATNLTPGTAYQFRARDCDPVTCSRWSAPLKVTTARIDPNRGKVVVTLDGGSPLGTALTNAQGIFDIPITIPAGTPAGPHTIHATGDSARAEETIQVAAPAPAGGARASIMMVGVLRGETGCPNHPISSTQTDDTFMLFGSGFAAGSVTIHLDNASGATLGTAAVRPDRSICQQMRSPPGNKAGSHAVVAVQNGAAVAQTNINFVLPSGVH